MTGVLDGMLIINELAAAQHLKGGIYISTRDILIILLLLLKSVCQIQ